MTKPTYDILRQWKKNRGFAFDRLVLKWHQNHVGDPLDRLKSFGADVIVPMPQMFLRSWRLSGSPASKIAEWISSELSIPVYPLLSLDPYARRRHRRSQAKRRGQERFEGEFAFRFDLKQGDGRQRNGSDDQLRKLILVDDFMTTGHTLSEAAQVLSYFIPSCKIHVFTLGVKVSTFEKT